MNIIKELQNTSENLKLLAAQRVTYARAKQIFGWQILLTVGFAVLFNFIRLLPKDSIIDFLPHILCFSVLVSVLDLLVFVTFISKMRTNGAKIQEQFDCAVYNMGWNKYNSGAKADKNFVHNRSKEYTPDPKKPIENWYDLNIEDLSQERAILLCQETNLWYDSNLRDKFKNTALYVLIGMSTLSFIISLVMKQDVGIIVIQVVAPLLPAIILTIKIYQENHKSSKASNELKGALLGLKESSDNPSMEELRKIQDKIFCSRKDGALVPEWFYKIHRPALEEGMKVNAS
ncbi:S-4TM family putative pore-forming effector [Parachryseolinea silvisoli]|uniref:S-4TM family putative pore-forming effector n=1 Tax=Parachryseolinea silvisoli TaxID=2873601 RepID=UPI0022659791|nr:S-4TM family putative pore-forming effector [Parachryseolinea silvisoli]MCD9014435.1 hypothetical protein [Parachryseolinea silvisoli]